MTAIKAADAERFISKPGAATIILVYGPDEGLVRERVDKLAAALVDDPNDGFAVVKLESDALGTDPGRLADEVNSIPMFGGRRVVVVKVSSRHNILPSIEAVLENPPQDCRVIIEAGELRANAPLRSLCEKSKTAAAVACYPDRDRDIARLIDEEMREAGLAITPDARDMLATLLGADRLASRSELRKLATFAAGKTTVTIDDIVAVVSDASAEALDSVVDAAFAGQPAELETEFKKARNAGSNPAAIVGAALRQSAQLHRMRLALDSGDSIDNVMMRGRPPVHFSRKQRVETALRAWNAARLETAMGQLAAATLETRRQPGLAETIAQRTLLSMAAEARRRN